MTCDTEPSAAIKIRKNHKWQRGLGSHGYRDTNKWSWIVSCLGIRIADGSTHSRRGAISQARRAIKVYATPDNEWTKVDHDKTTADHDKTTAEIEISKKWSWVVFYKDYQIANGNARSRRDARRQASYAANTTPASEWIER